MLYQLLLWWIVFSPAVKASGIQTRTSGLMNDKVRRHDPHDGERAAAQPQLAAQDGSVAAVKLLPHPIAENDLLLFADLAFVFSKSSAQQRTDL